MRERAFTESYEKLRRIPEYARLERDTNKIGTVMLRLDNGRSVCVDTPGFYLQQIPRYARLKEAYRRAATRPWERVGPVDGDELGRELADKMTGTSIFERVFNRSE